MKENKTLEIFKPINDVYSITSWGRVWSKNKNDFLYLEKTKKGYLRVKLQINGKIKNFKVHRLVAKAFIPNIHQKEQVNHIDGNKENNSITNLEWVTNKENNDKAKELRLING